MKNSWIEKVQIDEPPHAMLFGRDKDLLKAKNAVRKNKHLIIHGEFGIGKSTLAKAAAEASGKNFGILSLEDSVSPSLHRLILDARRKSLLHGSKPVTAKAKADRGESMVDLKKHLLFLKERHELDVLIIDNIFKVTAAKLAFLRLLKESGFTLILVLETDTHPDEVFQLRAICLPAVQITLSKLSSKESELVFRGYNSKFGLSLSEEQIRHYAKLEIGYPLFMSEKMKELVGKKPKKAAKSRDSRSPQLGV